MEDVTYDLRRGDPQAQRFYRALAAFADRTLEHVENHAGALLSAYAHLCASRGEEPRGRGEYAVELLTFGVTWLRYGSAARDCPRGIVRVCRGLYGVRRRHARLKPLVDRLRGRLSSRFLLPPAASGRQLSRSPAGLLRLIEWLDATGEFKDEVKRLRNWHDLACRSRRALFTELLDAALDSGRWLELEGRRELGDYTSGVAAFLRDRHPAYANREDRIFCGRSEVEYHLAMLSSELTNRGLREAFLSMPRKVVLLPGCMRKGDGCKAHRVGDDLRCAACSDVCAVARVTRLGRGAGFETRIIPHSTGFTRSLLQYRGSTEQGVVAVACALNIVPGGYEMRELRIASQCVLLDYSGCRRHWHPQGIPTDLSDDRLLEIVSNAAPSRAGV